MTNFIQDKKEDINLERAKFFIFIKNVDLLKIKYNLIS